MYLRLVRFRLGPGARSTAEKLADEFVPAIKAQNGCSECVFIADDDAGEYGIVVHWDSKEDADAAAAAMVLVCRMRWLTLPKNRRACDFLKYTNRKSRLKQIQRPNKNAVS